MCLMYIKVSLSLWIIRNGLFVKLIRIHHTLSCLTWHLRNVDILEPMIKVLLYFYLSETYILDLSMETPDYCVLMKAYDWPEIVFENTAIKFKEPRLPLIKPASALCTYWNIRSKLWTDSEDLRVLNLSALCFTMAAAPWQVIKRISNNRFQ